MARQRILKVAGVSQAQQARWEAAAHGERSLSAWLRTAADAIASGSGGTTSEEADRIEATLREVRRELNKTQAYNNLNQLVRLLHLDRQVGLPLHASAADADVMAAVRAISAIKDRIQDALDDLRMLRP